MAGRLKLTYPDDEQVSIRFSMNDLTSRPDVWRPSYEELRQQGMPIRQLNPEMLVPPGGYELLGSCPIAVQANFIPGGCLISVCLNHSFFDGLGGAMAVGFWAENCKDLQNSTHRTMYSDLEHLQRFDADLSQLGDAVGFKPLRLPNVLLDSTAPHGEELKRIQGDRTLWQLLGLQKPPTDPIAAWGSPTNKTMVSAIFVASSQSILRLKAESTSSGTEGDEEVAIPFVSSFDAIAALVWRCILRARYLDLEDPGMISSRLRIPINVRQILGIPHDYHGNVLLNSMTETSVKSLIAEADRTQIAPKIRSSLIFGRDAKRVLDAIKLSFVLPDLASRRPLFSDTTRQDLVLTSWQDMPYYKHDWGPMFGCPGNPEFFRIPRGHLRGICALQPRRENDRTEILVSLEQGQMDQLKSDVEFTEYFELKAL
ncbi:MAG: hypothetical protein ALECFALPRED_010912 [Alectoria fallacina]|uniref:Trichothecene 3-O-acetyltransferase n=1 Tax=Alectoria fallacina TaxID=1903189 RepID=A0A8H3F3H5_9LECA|nr:MAG: hypothetical protein ALECFALPRED_010912 [Alectoria fallacina]